MTIKVPKPVVITFWSVVVVGYSLAASAAVYSKVVRYRIDHGQIEATLLIKPHSAQPTTAVSLHDADTTTDAAGVTDDRMSGACDAQMQ